MADELDPNVSIDTNDPGDDIQRRFRYQCTYAAVLALHMFEDNSILEEIYCELHEDILLKFVSGKFGGVQVKTREIDLGPFDFHDEQIIKSIARFIEHDKKFKDKFEIYTIATNVGFNSQPAKSLEYLINLAKEGKNDVLLKSKTKSKPWITSLSKKCNCTCEEVIDVLKKIRLKNATPQLTDIRIKLVQTISEVLNLNHATIGSLNGIADSLILKHIEASSLSNHSTLSEHFILSTTPEEDERKTIIEGKRITKKIIEEVVNKHINDPITLFIKDSDGVPGELGAQRLELKMDAGGISRENIVLTKDNKYSFEVHTASWLYKYDKEECDQRYNQIKLIVNNECQEAFDEVNNDATLFGTTMLIDVRKRLKKRYESEKDSFFDCKYEHLIGASGILTEECKIWWSKKFDLKE